MGTYKERITADIKAAMRATDKPKLQVLRSLLAAIKSAQDDRGEAELSDQDEQALLMKAVKTRKDSVEQAKVAERQDIVDSEQYEVDVITAYLPEMLSGDALLSAVHKLAEEIGYEGPKDKGRFMKEWMGRYRGQAEGRDVQAALGQL